MLEATRGPDLSDHSHDDSVHGDTGNHSIARRVVSPVRVGILDHDVEAPASEPCGRQIEQLTGKQCLRQGPDDSNAARPLFVPNLHRFGSLAQISRR